MDEPWIIFMEELRDRAEDIPAQEFQREDDMAEAAHEAYQAASDRLHNQLDWKERDALRITKGFMRVVNEWIEEGELDFDELEERLELFQKEWEEEMGTSPA